MHRLTSQYGHLRKKINIFFLRRVPERGESSLFLPDEIASKLSYLPLSSVFILVTVQAAGVKCSGSAPIIL